jgi:hypothetical protein
MATFQCPADPFYDETNVDATTDASLGVESQWGSEYRYSASGSVSQAAWQPEQLPACALALPKPLYATSRGASQPLYMSGGAPMGVGPSVTVHTTGQLSGVWKAFIVLALMLACVAVVIAAFALVRANSCSCESANASSSVAAGSSSDSLAELRSAVSALTNASHNGATPQLTEAIRLLNVTLANALINLSSAAALTASNLSATAQRVGMLDATVTSQQSTLSSLSVAVPHLNDAATSLNASLVSQQAALVNLSSQVQRLVRTVPVLSISPSNLSLCAGGWTTQKFSDLNMTLCRKVADSGCGSIFVAVPAGTVYSRVEGWVTLYQYGAPDAFHTFGFPVLGDSLTIWSGSTLLWDYAVGISGSSAMTDSRAQASTCPATSGAPPSASLNSFWSCDAGNTGNAFSYTTFYVKPLFGPSWAFARYLAASTSAAIELRFCLNELRSTDEEIYLHSASVSVRL